MRRFLTGLLLIPLVGITACGALELQVDVLDPYYLDTINTRNELFAQLQEALDSGNPTKVTLEGLKEEDTLVHERLAAAYRRDAELSKEERNVAAAKLQETAASFLEKDFKTKVWPSYDETIKNVASIDEHIRAAVGEDPPDDARGLDLQTGALSRWLLKRQSVLQDFYAQRKKELIGMQKKAADANSKNKEASNIARKHIRTTELKLDSLIGGQGLAEDQYAYAVASAADKHWAKEFNKTYGGGKGGDVNVAIKMQGLADFTIKGLTFDPSGVAQIAAKAATQAVVLAGRIAASSFGIPSMPSIGGGEAEGTTVSSVDSANIESQVFMLEAELQNRRDALYQIAGRILTEQTNIQRARGPELARIKEAIRASFDAHQSRLIVKGNEESAGNQEGGSNAP